MSDEELTALVEKQVDRLANVLFAIFLLLAAIVLMLGLVAMAHANVIPCSNCPTPAPCAAPSPWVYRNGINISCSNQTSPGPLPASMICPPFTKEYRNGKECVPEVGVHPAQRQSTK